MIKLKKLQIIPKDASINEKRDIQFITTDVYIEKDQIIVVLMHIRGKTITDSWVDIATQDYLEKEGIRICTLLCKDGRNRLSNIIVDEQVLKLIGKNEKDEQNHANKIVPKFKVGYEIKTANEEPLTITKIDEKGYWSEDLFICEFDDAAKWELVEQKHTDKGGKILDIELRTSS